MTMHISVAGICFRIEHRYKLPPCMKPFLVDGEPQYVISVSDEEIEAERALTQHTNGYLEFVCIYRKIAELLPDHDAFVMHGAVVCMGENCYLITAPSGTGKTTHVKLWHTAYPEAWVLNGDKPIIRKVGDRFIACGTPWNGKERFGVPGEVPLKGIAMLRRGADNSISASSGREMVSFLMKQVYIPKDPLRRIHMLELLNDCLLSVPTYSLTCNMDPSAAILSYETMSHAGSLTVGREFSGFADSEHEIN